eukprot:GFUD01036590.1.p1 GENE.GFUD01036590.1~~GFUD01036590.1.p1  ORF type:complete len:569 (-),score=216.01 GFUD01036590.1:72-1778(-)
MATVQLFDDFWSWRMKQSPEFGTMVGCKEYNDVLETFTEERFEEDFKSCNKFVERAKELLKTTTDPTDCLNLEFFIAEVSTYTDGYHLKGFYFPINYMEGVHIDFQRLPEWATPGCVKDYEDLLARYRAFPVYAEQIVAMMRIGVKKQMTNHAVSMKGVVDQCKEHGLAVAEETAFYKPFMEADNIEKTEKERLQNDAKDAIKQCVQVGFMKIAEFLADEYLAACRPQIAATSLPGCGPEFYKACLKFHTSTDLTAEEIHQKGVQEVARIEGEMKEIMKELGMDMPLTDFMECLRKDKANFFSSAEELLDTFSTIIHDRINPNLTKIFHFCPKSKLEITEAPMADYPAAFYIAGTEDGARPGKLFVNTFKYASQPRYEMVSLALHETNPGHHLQGSYMLEKEGMPQFRKVMEDRVYSQAPSRFPINTAYVEGWGLYSETLGHDLGLYDDPMDKYGHLSEEIFRACRLVVDTGMHALGWSMEQAVEYMMEHSAASKENIVGEVNRYVTWPGQAVGYKIGQMKIIELRRRAEQALGDKFDIKQFHEVVLRAAGPLNILERQVDQFIKSSC